MKKKFGTPVFVHSDVCPKNPAFVHSNVCPTPAFVPLWRLGLKHLSLQCFSTPTFGMEPIIGWNKGTKKERECLIEPIGESHRNLHWISLVEIMYTFSYEGMFFFISYIHKSQLLTVYFLSRKLCGIRINCPKISFTIWKLETKLDS